MMAGFKIAPFSAEHIERASEIERDTFSEPWSSESLRLLCTPEYPSIVILNEGGECVGYVSSAKALDELEIINVAVDKSHRGRGLGTLLMQGFDELCASLEISLASLEVRESNLAAISLYEKFGFAVVGRRRAFYRAPTEDALVMIKNFQQGE